MVENGGAAYRRGAEPPEERLVCTGGLPADLGHHRPPWAHQRKSREQPAEGGTNRGRPDEAADEAFGPSDRARLGPWLVTRGNPRTSPDSGHVAPMGHCG